MRICGQCNQECVDGAKFCPHCGAALPETPAIVKAEESLDFPPEEHTPDFLRDPPPAPAELEPELSAEAPPPEPPAPPAKESKKPRKEKTPRTSGDSLGFGRGLLSVLLCVLLFLFLLCPILIYEIRDSTSEERIKDILTATKASSIKASDLIPGGDDRQKFSDWLSSKIYDEFGDVIDLSGKELETFIERSTLKDFLAEKLFGFWTDLNTGSADTEITRRHVSKMLQDNLALIDEEFDLKLDKTVCDAIAKWVDSEGLLENASVEKLKYDTPYLYYTLHIGLSWYAFGLLLLLALLLFICLCKAVKSVLRALRGLGVTLIVLGALFVAAALMAKLLPGVWELVCVGNYVVSSITGQILFAHIVIPGLCLLGIGILLTLVCGLIHRRKIAARQTAAIQ